MGVFRYLSVGERAAFLKRAAGDKVPQGKGQLSEVEGTFRGRMESMGEFVFSETEVLEVTVERKAQEGVEW